MAVGFYVAKYVNKKSDMDLAAKGLGAKEWNNSLKTKLSLLPKKLFRIRMSRNFGMKMLTMTNLSTECLIQLTKLGYDATPFNQILKQNAKREMRLSFFFQAEDGIRAGTVTGVQTCALPILIARPDHDVLGLQIPVHDAGLVRAPEPARDLTAEVDDVRRGERASLSAPLRRQDHLARSEERRVGKAWRSRLAPEPDHGRPSAA